MNYLKSLVLFLLTPCFTNAQLISEDHGTFGLLQNSGKVLLPNQYDKIEKTNYSPLYKLVQNGKVGWYDLTDSVLQPCIYDELIYNNGGYLIRSGKLYGFISPKWNGKNHTFKTVVPRYTSLSFVGDKAEFLSASNDSLYGLISNDQEPKIIIPFEMPDPILHSKDYGFYYQAEKGVAIMLMQDKKMNKWNKIRLHNCAIYTLDTLLIIANWYMKDYTIPDRETGKSIVLWKEKFVKEIIVYHKITNELLHYFPNSDSAEMHFSDFSNCIEKIQRVGEMNRVSWYNNVTGQLFFSKEIKPGDIISVNGKEVCIVSSIAFGEKFTYLGTIKDCVFTPYDKPRIEKDRSIVGSGTRTPWWLPHERER